MRKHVRGIATAAAAGGLIALAIVSAQAIPHRRAPTLTSRLPDGTPEVIRAAEQVATTPPRGAERAARKASCSAEGGGALPACTGTRSAVADSR